MEEKVLQGEKKMANRITKIPRHANVPQQPEPSRWSYLYNCTCPRQSAIAHRNDY